MKIIAKEIPAFEDHARFFKFIKVNMDSGCWEWQGTKSVCGYGKFHIVSGDYSAHRVSYDIFIEKMSIYLVIDHKCRNRSCVNPDHLRAVTESTNILENSLCGAAVNKQKTHCIRGHELVGENLIRSKMRSGSISRNCRTCFYMKRKIRRMNGSKH